MIVAYNFCNYPFFILKSLNKVENKVIFMREFEISLFETRRLPIKGSLFLRTF
jgi:hypothetical protein